MDQTSTVTTYTNNINTPKPILNFLAEIINKIYVHNIARRDLNKSKNMYNIYLHTSLIPTLKSYSINIYLNLHHNICQNACSRKTQICRF